MTPLWLDYLKTPMAAPETAGLRRRRLIWQGLCLATAAAVAGFDWLKVLLGVRATVLVAALLGATVGHGIAYLRRKQRADDAYLEAAVSRDS